MRKKSWAEPFLNENSTLVLAEPACYKGHWKSLLNCDSLHVEIGCGKGDYITQMARQSENTGWIGVERERNVAAVAVKKALEQPHENIRFIALDADHFEEWFEVNELAAIHLNFSDPWPKSGYRKRRLTYQGFLNKYAHCLQEKGQVIMKTDNSTLFEFSLCEFDACGWKLLDVSVDFRRKEHPEDAITEYERRFMDLGQPIYRAIWQKNG